MVLDSLPLFYFLLLFPPLPLPLLVDLPRPPRPLPSPWVVRLLWSMIRGCNMVTPRRCRNKIWVVVLHSSPMIRSSCVGWSWDNLLNRCCIPCCNGGGRRSNRGCSDRCGGCSGCCVGCSGCRIPRRRSSHCCCVLTSSPHEF